MRHTVKAFVYGFHVPGHEHALGLRQILMCFLHIPFSEIWKGVDQMKALEIAGAKMEKTRQATPRCNK